MSPYPNYLVAIEPRALISDEARYLGESLALVAGEAEQKHVVCVVPPVLEHYLDLGFTPLAELTNRLQQEEQDAAMINLRRYLHGHLKEAEYDLVKGDPAAEIARLTKQLRPSLLAIGLHHHNPLIRLTGTTTSRILSSQHQDLLGVLPSAIQRSKPSIMLAVRTASDLQCIEHKIPALLNSACRTEIVSASVNERHERLGFDGLQQALSTPTWQNSDVSIVSRMSAAKLQHKGEEVDANILVLHRSVLQPAQDESDLLVKLFEQAQFDVLVVG